MHIWPQDTNVARSGSIAASVCSSVPVQGCLSVSPNACTVVVIIADVQLRPDVAQFCCGEHQTKRLVQLSIAFALLGTNEQFIRPRLVTDNGHVTGSFDHHPNVVYRNPWTLLPGTGVIVHYPARSVPEQIVHGNGDLSFTTLIVAYSAFEAPGREVRSESTLYPPFWKLKAS